MSYIEKLKHHERLMTTMAERNGADLVLAEQVGLVSPEEIFEATQACTGCGAVSACESHLSTGDAGLPNYCRNSEMIRRIADDMDGLGLNDA